MSRQFALRMDEDFIESCKDHDQVQFAKCYGCRLTFPETDLAGGFCQMCSDIYEKEDDTEEIEGLDKSPRFAERGGNLTKKTGLMPADA